jgi:hypothetical protein
MKLDWLEVFALADCAARLLSQERPRADHDHITRWCKMELRRPAVEALRALWKNGDDATRKTVGARIHVWLRTGRVTAGGAK